MYQRDQNKKKIGQSTPYGYQPPQKTFQAQPVSAKPQANLGSQLTQMGAGMALNKGMDAGINKAGEMASQYAGPMAKNAMAAIKAPFMNSTAATGAMNAGVDAGIANAMTGASVAPTVAATTGTGAAATGAAGAGMGAGMAALGTAVPYIGAGLLAGKALGLFSEGGKVYAAEGEKVKMTPEQRAAFYNLQISNGAMTPEIAQNALLNEFGMRPGIAQSLIQSEYNVRQTPTGPTSLMGNTPQVPNLPQSREVPMMNAPVNPYDEFTQVPRDLQQPPGEVTVNVQPRGQTPIATNTTPYQQPATATERTAAMEDLVTPTRVQETAASEDIGAIPGDRGLNMGSFLGPLALAYILGNR